MIMIRIKDDMTYCPETGFFKWVNCDQGSIKKGDIAGAVLDSGYRIIGYKGSVYKAHRLAFLFMEGEIPALQIDHINGNKDDNRFCNLRPVTHSENQRNQVIAKNNSSGFTGIIWCNHHEKWLVRISSNGKRVFIGYYKCKLDAVAERIRANKKFNYHENHGRHS